MDRSKVITLAKFNSVQEAEIVKSLLDSAGVDNMLVHDVMGSMLSTAGGFIEVFIAVNEKDEQHALEVLSADYDMDEYRREAGLKPLKKKKCE